ncbi:glycosyltransferase family 4 protein [Halomonas sp. RT37]|uniref:Glycosyltransferase family 4 protein n=1 Tax=Halomonas sp. RT37 TaxID=2950872 RepID=A0AAU7KCP1_9GAMM
MIKRLLMVASYPESIVGFRGELIREMVARGIEVHVAAPVGGRGATGDAGGEGDADRSAASSRLKASLEALGATLHDIPLSRTGMNPLADLKTLVALMKLMLRVRPDGLFAYTIKPVVYGALAAWVLGVRQRTLLVTGLGYAFTGTQEGTQGGAQGGNKRRLIKALVRRLYRVALGRAHMVLFQNPDDRRLFIEEGILLDTTASRVINGSGVDLAHFSPVAPATEPVSFLLIARLLGDKGVREYAEAATRIRQRHPQVRFRLAGWLDDNPDSIEAHELQTWIDDGAIEYLGRLDDVRPAIAECSVYVLPSYREGTPRTVLEAMALGRAVVTTDAPGCRETVAPGVNGYLVEVKDVDALCLALQRYLETPALIVQHGQASRARAEERYDVHRVNHSILDAMGVETASSCPAGLDPSVVR